MTKKKKLYERRWHLARRQRFFGVKVRRRRRAVARFKLLRRLLLLRQRLLLLLFVDLSPLPSPLLRDLGEAAQILGRSVKK